MGVSKENKNSPEYFLFKCNQEDHPKENMLWFREIKIH